MIKKIILLTSICTITLFSASTIADVLYDLFSNLQKTSLSPVLEVNLNNNDAKADCTKINDSGVAGEICLNSDIDGPATGFLMGTDFLLAPKVLRDFQFAITPPAAECISASGSSETAGSTIGFCMAADLSASDTDIQHFSFKNDLPATGIQFMEAIFADGSTQTSSAQMSQECLLPDGSPASFEGEDSGGFCMISSLRKSISEFSTFSLANGLPMVSMQFIQIQFKDIASQSQSSDRSLVECQSVGGSAAQATGKEGFCLSSDLSNSIVKSANFSIAHNAPVTDLVFVQLTFSDDNITNGQPSPSGLGAPIGAECISVAGSISAGGNIEGSCLVSDLVISATASANIALANDLPISGLQFFQASFADQGDSNQPSPTLPVRAECVSMNGSIAATEKTNGFCLASDLQTATGSAVFTIANDLPVTSWEFIQVPSKDASPLSGSSNSASGEVPDGIAISNNMAVPFNLQAEDSLAYYLDPLTRYFHISNQTIGMEVHSTLYWRDYPNLAIWLGR